MNALLLAATLAVAQPGPAVRDVPPAFVASTDSFASVTQVWARSGGRVLLNDAVARRLLLLDSTMRVVKVVADSISGAENVYGVRAGRLIPYRGDTVVLIDAASLSMLLIDGDGNPVDVRAAPRPDFVTYFTGTTYGNPGLDARGRLVFRISDPSASFTVATGGGIVVPMQPDSAPVLRLDYSTRAIDTAGNVRIQKRISEAYRTPSGSISTRTLTTPMPVLDDWAVMADGSIAFVRHRDYHIDWLNLDGTRTSSPIMPFEWQRMTDDHKKAFIDSVRISLEETRNRSIARYDSINTVCFSIAPPAREGYAVPARATAAASAATPPRAGAAPTRPPPSSNCPAAAYVVDAMLAPVNVISADMLPDYKPPFSGNSTLPDIDGNLWIRMNQMRPVPNTTLYDVINRQGELFDRLRFPAARTLVGFGGGGIAYVSVRAGTAFRLERVRWR